MPKESSEINLKIRTGYASPAYPVVVEAQQPDSSWQEVSQITSDDPNQVISLNLNQPVKKLILRLRLKTPELKGSAQIHALAISSITPGFAEPKLASASQIDSVAKIVTTLPRASSIIINESDLPKLNVTKPTLLVKLSSYDQNWRLNNQQKPLPALGYAQGYLIKPGDRIKSIEFLPEKPYQLAIRLTNLFWILSLLALLISTLSLLVSSQTRQSP